jgi:hypothetical protein
MLKYRLKMTELHALAVGASVARQRAVVREMEHTGRDCTKALRLLDKYEGKLRTEVDRWFHIRGELDKLEGPASTPLTPVSSEIHFP